MTALSLTSIVVLIMGALVVGFSKTAVAGFGPVATVLFNTVMSARDATGAIIVLLIACDVIAVIAYRRSCDWRLIRILIPSLIIGIALGALFITRVDDVVLRRSIGAMLLLMGLIQLGQEVRKPRDQTAPVASAPELAPRPSPRRGMGLLAGIAAGFTTMTANAAGPVMSFYLLYLQVPKFLFVGTSAWFYGLANLVKLPFALAIGLVHPASIWLNLALVVPAFAGCALGLWVLPHISQKLFDRLALGLAVASSILLLR